MSNQVAVRKDVRSLIESEKFREEVAKVLPKHVTPERMARIAMTAVMKTPALLNCTPESVLNSLMLCSQAGLEPDGRLAHLIPYGQTCQVIFDYKGLVALALRNGYDSVSAEKVCEGDEFDARVVNGEKKLTHVINWKEMRGAAYAYYAMCIRNGKFDFEVMSRTEVEAIRERSRAGRSGPWQTDFDEMGKKSALRRMSKRWDLMPEIRDVINADDDTPPAINEIPKVTTPIFTSTESPKPTQRQLEPSTESADTQESDDNVVFEEEALSPSAAIKKIRERLKKEKMAEGKLIEYLVTLGSIELCRSLEEVHQQSDTAIGMVVQRLDDIVEAIKESK